MNRSFILIFFLFSTRVFAFFGPPIDEFRNKQNDTWNVPSDIVFLENNEFVVIGNSLPYSATEDFTSMKAVIRKSENAGATWKTVFNDTLEDGAAFTSAAYHAGKPIVAIGEQHQGGKKKLSWITYTSLDNGETWKLVNTFECAPAGHAEAYKIVYTSAEKFVAIGSCDGINLIVRESIDGESWRTMASFEHASNDKSFIETVDVDTQGNFYFLDDNGRFFTLVNENEVYKLKTLSTLPNNDEWIFYIMYHDPDGTIYAAGSDDDTNSISVRKSIDGGKSWILLSSQANAPYGSYEYIDSRATRIYKDSFGVLFLYELRDDYQCRAYLSPYNCGIVYKSIDDGISWSIEYKQNPQKTGQLNFSIYSIHYDLTNHTRYFLNGGYRDGDVSNGNIPPSWLLYRISEK